MQTFHWQRLALNCLAAFLAPIGLAFAQGKADLRGSCLVGLGMAITAAVAFIQPPTKPGRTNGGDPPV